MAKLKPDPTVSLPATLPSSLEAKVLQLEQSLKGLNTCVSTLDNCYDRLEDRMLALEVKKEGVRTVAGELQSCTTSRPFLTLPDGTRLALQHLESWKPYGAHGISLRTISGEKYTWEVSAQLTPEKQKKQRDEVLKALDEQMA